MGIQEKEVLKNDIFLDKIEYIIASLCHIDRQTPFSLMIKTSLSLQNIYGIISILLAKSIVRRNTISRNTYYIAHLTETELRNGLLKWPEIANLYPEIPAYIEKQFNQKIKNLNGA